MGKKDHLTVVFSMPTRYSSAKYSYRYTYSHMVIDIFYSIVVIVLADAIHLL